MHIVPQRRAKPTVSLVPLIDIMVMILIFFIITMAPRENRQAVTLVLAQSAQAETAESKPQGAAIAVSLDAEGQVYLQGEAVEPAALIESLKAYRSEFGPNWKPQFLFDQEANWQDVINVMGWVAEAGIQVRQSEVEVRSE